MKPKVSVASLGLMELFLIANIGGTFRTVGGSEAYSPQRKVTDDASNWFYSHSPTSRDTSGSKLETPEGKNDKDNEISGEMMQSDQGSRPTNNNHLSAQQAKLKRPGESSSGGVTRAERTQATTVMTNNTRHNTQPQTSILQEPAITNGTSKRSQNRQRRNKRKRRLPSNPSDIHPMNLLLQMKLVEPPTNTYANFTLCNDISPEGKKIFVGWKASITVNLDHAGDRRDAIKNPFVGYGKDKRSAKRIAAELALLAVYPDQLVYPKDDFDFSKYEPYCDDSAE